MKVILAMALALAIALGAVGMIGREAAAETAGNALGLRALALLSDGTHNQFVSPVSLGFALSMAALGAQGDTARELLDALGVSDPSVMADMLPTLEASGLRCANAAFIRDGFDVKQAYIDGLSGRFEAELFPLKDAGRVNAWVAEKTDNLIDSLVGRVSDDIQLMLVNAVAMHAEWAQPFEPSATRESTFHAPDGDVKAQLMRDTFYMPYGESALGQFARLSYRQGDLYMLVVLPRTGGLDAALQALAEDCEGAIPKMTYQEVSISLPKMDISALNSLASTLQALGIETAFTNTADFTGISDSPLYVSAVLQKVRVQLDETSTRAAAVTGVGGSGASRSHQEKRIVEMKVDRPFALLIIDEATGAVCFAGAVYDPTQK